MATYFAKPDRRDMLRNLGLGLLGTSCASWLPALAAEVAQTRAAAGTASCSG